MGVDPLGGAGVHYWARIAERYKLDLTVVSEEVDPTFGFMTLDWDGRIRMDPSSAYAMQRLIGLKDRYDIAFACDTDHDRHGIVTPSAGLLPPNHYLAVAIDYLFRNRPRWNKTAAVGKTVVSSAMIDRVTARLGRKLYEVPVGFKWFVDGLFDGSLGFGGEESAGASFSRMDGAVWTTDKDGIVPALLSAEITARTGRDPGELYRDLTRELGAPAADRVEAPATPEQKQKLAKLSPEQVQITELAGEPIDKRARPRAGQRRADRRHQGDRRQRLVRRAAFRHRGHLQDLRGKFPRRGPSARTPARGAGHRRSRAGGGNSGPRGGVGRGERTRKRRGRSPRPPSSALAGIVDIGGDAFHGGIFVQRLRGEIQQPRAHHAAITPDLGDLVQVETELLLVLQDGKAFGIGLHQPVFDAVVNHFAKVT